MTHSPRVAVTPTQEQAALAWLCRLHDQPSRGDQARFSLWLQADPAHVEAYAQAQVLWALSEGPASSLAREEADVLQGLLEAMDRPKPATRWRWSAGLAMAACLLLAVSIGLGFEPRRWLDDLGADYVSLPGQVRTVTLADQSAVTLDTDSAISVDFSAGERHVRLRRGSAFFQVTHTGAPFVVDAEDGEARVLGTQFEVRLQPGGARVTVLSGRVGVRASPGAPQQILAANQQVAYAEGSAPPPQPVDSDQLLAWRQGWLNYSKVTLAEVVQDLGRYYPGRILVLNDSLAARRISGSFPNKDPRAVLDSLQGVLGFEQHSLLGRVIVLR
ncbi:FecR family protein [Pseudomonas batumici]|uniref:Iron siderophore sensor protein n=1 Tax=Pseudomonas batumici TaxID=226910 RepID=A0A0C2IE70_9PSED|nr:FecR family protein [Pseudomonas batumici]KIH85250.1 Iron siderophore sensor protein [Pseudomonas batumici]